MCRCYDCRSVPCSQEKQNKATSWLNRIAPTAQKADHILELRVSGCFFFLFQNENPLENQLPRPIFLHFLLLLGNFLSTTFVPRSVPGSPQYRPGLRLNVEPTSDGFPWPPGVGKDLNVFNSEEGLNYPLTSSSNSVIQFDESHLGQFSARHLAEVQVLHNLMKTPVSGIIYRHIMLDDSWQ